MKALRFALVFFCFCALFCFSAFAAESSVTLSASQNATGTGWSWNAARSTLTLENCTLLFESGDGFTLPRGSIVRYSGSCSVTALQGSGFVCPGYVHFIPRTQSAALRVSAERYGVNSPDTVLFGEDVHIEGAFAAVSGLAESDGGVAFSVSDGDSFVQKVYEGERKIHTGRLYGVSISTSRGGVAPMYFGRFAAGERVYVEAYALEGFAFDTWRTADVVLSDENSYSVSFIMPEQSVDLYAVFERVYRVSVAELEGGHVERITESEAYAPGEQVVLYAVPDTGYYFSHWTSDYGRFRDPLQAYAALTMPHIDVTVKPVFEKGESYYLRVETQGAGTTNITIGNFAQNRSVLLRATPKQGYLFAGWMSTAGAFLSSSDAETFFVMPGENAVVTAVFIPSEDIKKTLTVEHRTGGTVNLTGGLFAPGTPITLSAVAKTGYEFKGWTVSPAEYASAVLDRKMAETELMMPPGDVTISAVFELLDPEAITFYLSLATSGEGTIAGDEGGNYLAGYEISLSATPAEGYYFAGWKSAIGGKFDNRIDPNTIFYMPANDTRVTAVFEKILLPEEGEGGGTENTPLPDEQTGEQSFLSFGISLTCCGTLAAGAVWYGDVARRACGLTPRRRARRRRSVKGMRPRRDLKRPRAPEDGE